MLFKSSIVFAVAGLFLTGCASGTFKARQEQREKLVGSSGLFCEFVNGEQHPDIDVELNMQMAKRCDASKPFSITNYKTSSEMNGVMYCCQVPGGGSNKGRVTISKPVPAPPGPAPAAPLKAPPAIAKPDSKEAGKPAPAAVPAPVIESNDEIISD